MTYTPQLLAKRTLARAEDLNAELLKIEAAISALYDVSNQVPAPYRATFASAIDTIAVGKYFTSDTTGSLRTYKRVNEAPGYITQDVKGDTGAPGGNVESIGPFIVGMRPDIGAGTSQVTTSGRTRGLFIEDATFSATDLAAHPHAAFQASDGRFFRRDPSYITNVMFGAINDGRDALGAPTLSGTDNHPAHAAMFAYLTFCSPRGGGFAGTYDAWIMPGTFLDKGTHSLDRKHTLRGFSTGREGGDVSELLFPANTTAFVLHHFPTSSDGLHSASGTTFDGVSLRAMPTGANLNSGACGVIAHCRFIHSNCGFYDFALDGVQNVANEGGGTPTSGNSNCWVGANSSYNGNGRHGLFSGGDNSNAGLLIGPNANQNGQYGWKLASGAINVIMGGQAANNGHQNAIVGTIGFVFNSGAYWSVIPGNEAAAKTTAPALGSIIWYRVRDAGGPAADIPQWISGGNYVAGGAGYIDSASRHYGAYCEGTQGAYYVGSGCLLEAGALDCGKVGPGRLKFISGAGSGGVETSDGPFEVRVSSATRTVAMRITAATDSGLVELIEDSADTTPVPRQFNRSINNGLLVSYYNDTFLSYSTGATPVANTFNRFGRANPVPYVSGFGTLAIAHESGNYARIMRYASSPPDGADFGSREVRWNDGTVPANDAVDYWIWKAGAWQARP